MITRFTRACATGVAAVAMLAAAGARANTPATLPDSAGSARPILAVDPSGVVYVGATAGIAQTKLWRLAPSATSLTPGGLLSALPGGAATSLAIDDAADVHLAQIGTLGATVRRSIDSGTTWDRGDALAAPGADSVSLVASKFNSIIEGATLTLVAETHGALTAARSIDGGLSFAPVSVVDPSCRQDCRLGGAVADENGQNVAVAYLRAGALEVATSTDGTTTFTVTHVAGIPNDLPSIARLASGALLLAWTESDRVVVAQSTGGATWFGFMVPVTAPFGARIASGTSATTAVAFLTIDNEDTSTVHVMRSEGWAGFTSPSVLDVLPVDPQPSVTTAADPTGGFVAAYSARDGIRVTRF